MSRPNTDFDNRINILELEWRSVYESSNSARTHYQALVSSKCSNADIVCEARERLGHAEALKDHVLEKIKQMEIKSLKQHQRISRRFM